jgi:tRNA A-37 threonylcarbamoyl transferase component Bud32
VSARQCPNGHALAETDTVCSICHTLVVNRLIGLPTPSVVPSIAGYQIIEVLGAGGMGIVYKAHQLKPSRIVALKMIRPDAFLSNADRARLLTRFRREADAIARLNHPNIIQIYEVGEHEGRPYFSMEYVEGGNLAARINCQPQPAQASAELLEVLSAAMHSAHERGIVHRDLKPQNVLLTATGVPKISDFGLAKQLDDPNATAEGTVMGSACFMAPEQVSGKTSEIGPAADVYALGAILYQSLTGRPPFLAETVLEIYSRVVNEDPVAPRRLQSHIPRALETICLKCLQKAPQRRYASAATLAEDLRRFRMSEPIRARRAGLLERLWLWSRRHPGVASLVVVLAAVVLAAIVGLTLLWRHAETARRDADRAHELLMRQIAASVDVAAMLKSSADRAELVPLIQRIAEAREHIVRDEPDNLDKRRLLSQTWFTMGVTLRDLGRMEEAIDPMRRAMAQHQIVFVNGGQTSKDRRWLNQYMYDLGNAYLKSGRAPEAAATALERAQLWPDDPNQIYDAACELARCFEQTEQTLFAAQAIEKLSLAIEKGFRDSKGMETDADLKCLHDREDFQMLRRKLAELPK